MIVGYLERQTAAKLVAQSPSTITRSEPSTPTDQLSDASPDKGSRPSSWRLSTGDRPILTQIYPEYVGKAIVTADYDGVIRVYSLLP